MLVLDTFFKDGAFVPDEPVANIKEGQKVRITIEEETEFLERQSRAFKKAKKLIEESKDEILPDDFPARIKFRTPEEVEAL